MMRLDEDALICDLAETYHIYDIKALSVSMLARLSCGLRQNSRIKMRMRGDNASFEDMISVAILDDLRWLRWSRTEDAMKNINQPPSLLDKLLGIEKEDDVTSFDTPEEFNERWAEINRR